MRGIALQYAVWLSVFAFFGMVVGGACRYLDNPDAKVPIESLSNAYIGMRELDPDSQMAMIGRLDLLYPFRVLWPTLLPPGATTPDIWSGPYQVAVRWHSPGFGMREPLLQFQQTLWWSPAALPDLPEVSVRGLPGRSGQLRPAGCLPFTPMPECGARSGIWWRDGNMTLSLTSAQLSTSELLEIAESLAPVVPDGPIAYQQKNAVKRGPTDVFAGLLDQFPVPSVTQLANVDVYVVRTSAGIVAFRGHDDRRFRTPVRFDQGHRRFDEPRGDCLYNIYGRTPSGPCADLLDRYPVTIQDGRVLIDLGVRYHTGWGSIWQSKQQPEWVAGWP